MRTEDPAAARRRPSVGPWWPRASWGVTATPLRFHSSARVDAADHDPRQRAATAPVNGPGVQQASTPLQRHLATANGEPCDRGDI